MECFEGILRRGAGRPFDSTGAPSRAYNFETRRRPMNSKPFLALFALLLALPVSAAGRETPFRTGGPEGGIVPRVVFSPDDPEIALATGYYGGVYFSDDGGHTWSRSSV